MISDLSWHSTPGSGVAQVAVGSQASMRKYAEVSALREQGAFQGLSPQRMYWQHLVGSNHFSVQPLPVGYSVDSTPAA